MSNMKTGSKFQNNLRTKDIAKRFRADVKAAQKAGDLPKRLKLSVYTSRGGSSIRVEIKDMPCGAHSARAKVIADRLDAMLREYRYDASDSRFDHFDTNFYPSVAIACHYGSNEEETVDWHQALEEARVSPPAVPAPTSAHENFLASLGIE